MQFFLSSQLRKTHNHLFKFLSITYPQCFQSIICLSKMFFCVNSHFLCSALLSLPPLLLGKCRCHLTCLDNHPSIQPSRTAPLPFIPGHTVVERSVLSVDITLGEAQMLLGNTQVDRTYRWEEPTHID